MPFVLAPVPVLPVPMSPPDTPVRPASAPAPLSPAPVLVPLNHFDPGPRTARAHTAPPVPIAPPRTVARHPAPVPTARAPDLHPAPRPSSSPFLQSCSSVPHNLDPVAHCATAARTAIATAPTLNAFISSCQSPTVAPPPPGSNHPASDLLSTYAAEGFPASVGAPWSLDTIRAAILQGPHVSTRTPEATAFCREELVERVARGFSLLLTEQDALRIFGTRLRISRLASVPQANRRNRLICDSTAPPPGGDSLLPPQHRLKSPNLPATPPVNESTDKSSAPPSM